ncbi:MAG: PAS domain-containing sensor histidine kinase, partial [Campylobacterales bacterium]
MLETIEESQRTLVDINKTLETRINAAVEEIREKDAILHENVKQRAMDEMLINIAHQWRQPL